MGIATFACLAILHFNADEIETGSLTMLQKKSSASTIKSIVALDACTKLGSNCPTSGDVGTCVNKYGTESLVCWFQNDCVENAGAAGFILVSCVYDDDKTGECT